MTARDLFWFAAGCLAATAAAFVVVPLLGRAESGGRRLALLVTGTAALAIAAVGLYAWQGTPEAIEPAPVASAPTAGAAAPSMESATGRLAARLAANGGKPEDWELLARSYEFLGRPEEAAEARRHAGPAPTAGADAPARIEGSIDLAPALASRAPPGATLFVYAKSPQPGLPPLAVLRLETGSWPLAFVLDDSNAMVPGRNLSGADAVVLEARISQSGNATPQAGDLVGTLAAVSPRAGQPVRIAIDRALE